MVVTLRSANRPFVKRSERFAPAVPSPLLQTPAVPGVRPAAAAIPIKARLQKRRKVEVQPWKETQAVKKVRTGYTKQQPVSPAAAQPTKRQKTVSQSKTRKTVKTGKGGIKEKIWCLDCRVQIESKSSNSLVRAHIRQHEARGERTLYARATPAGLYRVGPEFWTNNGQML